MEDHRFIPEFSSPSPVRAEAATPSPASSAPPAPHRLQSRRQALRFRKGDAVAEIRERSIREFQLIEWSLVLNGRVVTTRQFDAAERADFDHEVHRVTSDLAGSGWQEDTTTAA